MPAEARSWDEVLAAVEQDAQRTARLLADPGTPGPGTAEADGPGGLPAGADPAPLILPSLGDMPPVPPELRGRIEALREQIAALQAELSAALRDWHQPPRAALAPVPAGPRFLDCRV